MKILLTGSEGFIGQNLKTYLQDRHQLICLDKKTGNNLVTCNLDYDVDVVIHLAGLSGVRDSLDNPTEYWINNVVTTHRIFEKFNNKKILYASSSTAKEPWRNPYAMSKYYMETIAPENSIGMRFTTVYGPGARESMLIPRLLRNDVPYINVDHTRDFIHVNDIATAIGLLLLYEGTEKQVIDIGTGKSINLLDLLNEINIKKIEKKIGTVFERKDNTAQLDFLTKMGWKPKTDLINYIKENYDN